MAVEVERVRRRFTIEQYERMVETGILAQDDRVELIEGEIVEMSPIGDPHAAFVANLTHLLVNRFGDRARVWVQGPVRVPRAPNLSLTWHSCSSARTCVRERRPQTSCSSSRCRTPRSSTIAR